MTSGDLLASWAVEDVVHHLDLDVEQPPPDSALVMARRTAEAILGADLPPRWDHATAVLAATGRVRPPETPRDLVDRLPLLG